MVTCSWCGIADTEDDVIEINSIETDFKIASYHYPCYWNMSGEDAVSVQVKVNG